MSNLFTKHPNSIGETYWQHFWFATCFAANLLVAGICCLIHAIFPFVFKDTASNILARIVKKLKNANRAMKFEAVFSDKS